MKIAVITSSRADYGLLKPLIKKLSEDEFFDLKIIATGTHLAKDFGNTYKEIENDGFDIYNKLNIIENDDSPVSITKNCSNALSVFGNMYQELNPDSILVLGDRYEILCAVFSALFFKIPVIHYSGGEKTEGAFDDAIRHSITKMSHLHFVSCEEYRKRVIQLGERPEIVFNVGSLGIDNIMNTKLLTKKEFEESAAMHINGEIFLISYHPETLSELSAGEQFTQLLMALDQFTEYTFIFTKSNADSGGKIISSMIDAYVSENENVFAFDSLGLLRYLSAVKLAKVVIGNSSSGVTEVPAFNKPTVNIGDRQKGRIQAKSIINTEIKFDSIIRAINSAISEEFNHSLVNHVSPFGNGTASAQIIDIIKNYDFKGIVKKSFYDISFEY